MRYKTAAILFVCWAACCPECPAGEPFTRESSILAVSREDQTNALKTRLLKKEMPLSEVLAVLTTFPQVTREQYLIYDHQRGAQGTVTLNDGKTYTWTIEPGYAATVTDAKGATTYLLHPRLRTGPAGAARGKQARVHRYRAYWLISEKDGNNGYRLLLLTRLPLAELAEWLKAGDDPAEQPAGKGTPPAPILERAALFMRTHGTDSIWADDFRPIKPLGRFRDLNEKNRTVEANAARYTYEECPLTEVVRLLKNPEGTESLHRIYPALGVMEQTARALRLLLEEQLHGEESNAQPTRLLRKPVAEYGAAETSGPEGAVAWAELSPDGKLIACYRRSGTLTVYAVGEAKPLFTDANVDNRVSPNRSVAAFSADGTLIAFPGKGKRIEIRSARTGKPHASVELPGQAPERVDLLAFSPDGKQLAVSSGVLYHKNLHVFDTAAGKLLGQPLRDVDGMAWQMLFSADGKRLVANHYSTVYVVDATTHRLTAKVGGARPPDSTRLPAVFFRDGDLYAVQEDGAVFAITAAGIGKEPVGRLGEKTDARGLTRAAFAERPGLVAIAQGKEVSVRTLAGRERFRVTGADSPVAGVGLSADGRVLLVYRESQRAEVFRLE